MVQLDLPSVGLYAVVLGIAQDAGLPHAGCLCHRCAAAQADPTLAQFAASLAIIDARRWPPSVWLIDATPDIKQQLQLLSTLLGPHASMADRIRQPDGLFLTHGHMGHTAGLVHLGPEAMNVQQLPLYASPDLVRVLRETGLWRPLLNDLALRPLAAGAVLDLADRLSIRPVAVPHRDELSAGTYAYRIQGPERALIYIPDIDGWNLWPAAKQVLARVDVALVDASFYSGDELGGRPPVAHPLVPETLAFFADLPVQLVLTHLNHTNPLLDGQGPALNTVASHGTSVAYTGQVFKL